MTTVKATARELLHRVLGRSEMEQVKTRLTYAEASLQNMNLNRFQERHNNCVDPSWKGFLRGKELRVYSQNGEDGVIDFILTEIGVTNECFVEAGCGNGIECNTANLTINAGWRGLLIDCNDQCVKDALRFYRSRSEVRSGQVKVVKEWVTASNVNSILRRNDFTGPIDVLSIDIDGNDFWVWKALSVVKPRVVVIEYNASLGMRPLVVDYDPMFVRYRKHSSGYYHGAGLKALCALAESKGYALIGCESSGVNAFFVQEKLATNSALKKVTAEEAYYPLARRCLRESVDDQFSKVESMPWVNCLEGE